MKTSEFKQRIADLGIVLNDKEKARFNLISNKKLQMAGLRCKSITTDKEVKDAWILFNKKQAAWEKYCRKLKHEARFIKRTYADFSHLAYNYVSDDL